MSKVIDLIKSRPTETWLAIYTALVAVLVASGVDLQPTLVSAVQTLVAVVLTAIAANSDSLGP